MNPRRELAVVAGAAEAFGAAVTARLVEAGLDVLAVDRDDAALDVLGERYPKRVFSCAADVASDGAEASIRDAIDALERPVRSVVLGPRTVVAGGLLDAPAAAVIRVVDLEVGGLLRVVRAANDHFARDARIIAITGHEGLEPTAFAAASGIAGAALLSAVRQLSLAYGPRRVTAHTIALGPADIGVTTPEQVAWAVATLLSPEASAMTGSTMMLDAGRRRGLP
ncbi:MAG: SDR family oxidoreductase [Deltaproteobacteria bacterium]